MGMSLFGSSSLVNSFGNDYASSCNVQDPDPEKFKIKDIMQEGNFVIAEILYPNCTNYEGIKIIVFNNATVKEIKELSIIDPHFLENNKVFARFKPTIGGINAAFILCKQLNKEI